MEQFQNSQNEKASIINDKVRIERFSVNKKNVMAFHFKKMTIELEYIAVNSEEEIIILESYYPIYGKYGYGTQDFIEDILKLDKFIENNHNDDVIIDALDSFSIHHINEFKRIIDTDLYRNISLFILYMDVLSTKNGKPLNNDMKKNISETFARREFNIFSNYLYITKHKHENGKTIQYLEKLK